MKRSDWHCHLLPGIDDGPSTIDEATEMAMALQKSGFTDVYCTPHLIKGSYDADDDAVLSSLAVLRKKLQKENIKLNLIPGREYYLDEFIFDYLKKPLTMGDTKYIMIEIPNHVPMKFVQEVCFRIKRKGFTPMIAHPERCYLLHPLEIPTTVWSKVYNLLTENKISVRAEYNLLDYLVGIGCAFQANMGSFAGWYGADVERKARSMEGKNIYTHYGTDLHSSSAIKYLSKAVKILKDQEAGQFGKRHQ